MTCRRLAGVGVADDGGVRRFVFLALLALGLALLADVFELALAAVDGDVGKPAVHLDLFLTHAAGRTAAHAAAGAALAVEVAPHAGESRQRVLHAGKLDLQACLLGVGALGEDVENHLLAVDHAKVGEFLPLALLGRCEAVVDDDHVALVGAREFADLGGLAGAAEEFFVHLAAARHDGLDHLDAEGFDEFAEL